MKDAERYRAVTVLMLIVYVWLAIPAVFVAATLVAGAIDDGTWGLVAAGLILLVSAGFAMTGFAAIRRWRGDGYFARRFPGYAPGRRFPVFDLMRHTGPGFDRRFDKPDRIYALGEADAAFFILCNAVTKHNAGEPPIAGELLTTPNGRNTWLLPKTHIIDVAVVERDDAQIAGAAVDRREMSERVGAEIASRLTGARLKTTITPYAAYVIVTVVEAEGAPSQIVFGIPTDVTDDMLTAMRNSTPLTRADENWLIDSAVDKGIDEIRTFATDTADHHARALVGDRPVDLVEGGYGLATDAIDYGKDALSWLDPNPATVATTQGARGRAMAWLIATRIRAGAGLNDAGLNEPGPTTAGQPAD